MMKTQIHFFSNQGCDDWIVINVRELPGGLRGVTVCMSINSEEYVINSEEISISVSELEALVKCHELLWKHKKRTKVCYSYLPLVNLAG